MPEKEQTQKSGNKAGSKPQVAKPATDHLDVLASQHPLPVLTPAHVLQLQRTLGNRAVGKLMAGVRPRPVNQAKLTVDRANDHHGQKADYAAAQVMAMPDMQQEVTSRPLVNAMQREAMAGNAEPGLTGKPDLHSQGTDGLAGQTLLAQELTPTIQPTGSIQRTIDMTFQANVGIYAGKTSPRNKLYQEIRDTFKEYQKVSKKANKIKKTNKTNDYELLSNKEDELLKELKRGSEKWLDIHSDQRPNHKKTQDLKVLLAEISTELDERKSNKYIEKVTNKEYKYGLYLGTDRDMKSPSNFPIPKPWLIDGTTNPEDYPALEEKAKLEAQLKEEKLKKLTRGERAAITSYTNEQYKLINPAMAGDENWLKANLIGINKIYEKTVDFKPLDITTEGLKQAIAENKEIGALSQSGLHKLPDWKHIQTLYRGETFSIEQSKLLEPGAKKTYPHFVSTSLDLGAPRKQISDWKTKERPVAILWHITRSKHGKDVADLHKSGKVESEILFPADTTFQVDKVLKREEGHKELEAHEV